MMGLMLFFGQHDKMDRVKAKKFFQIAASRDHEESILMLEENYFEWKKVLR